MSLLPLSETLVTSYAELAMPALWHHFYKELACACVILKKQMLLEQWICNGSFKIFPLNMFFLLHHCFHVVYTLNTVLII